MHRPLPHRRLVLTTMVGLLLAAVCITGPSALPAAAGATGATRTYVVLYKQLATPADASAAVSAAGGELVATYPEIGVAIARSADTTFRTRLLKQASVEGVGASDTAAVRVTDDALEADGDQTAAPAVTAGDPLSGLQWDMDQISAPDAHVVTPGSASVLVGDIDTGLDYTHPDLAPNVDFANSASCVGGVANQDPAAWNDDNGHGTHTAGTIAAAANGIGIVGVAPGVRIAGIKASTSAGFFYPEAVVCSFMWAGSHGMQVTNNSYFADPWLFNCRNDAEQRAIWKAEQRAVRWAQSQGVLVVSAEGNDNKDLSKQNTDTISPDDQPPPPPVRDVTNACLVVPVELPGVVGVTADGNLRQKAYYSSYGQATADVTAPGGDRRFQVTAAAPNGRVLSTYPAALNPGGALSVFDCSVSPCASYAYLQGTSMASPHVAGVAALVMSQGIRSPGAVIAVIEQTANPIACPPNPFNPGPPFDFAATCVGGAGHNGFFGSGEVDALRAVS